MALSEGEQHAILCHQASATRTLHTQHRNADGTDVCAWCVEPWPCVCAPPGDGTCLALRARLLVR